MRVVLTFISFALAAGVAGAQDMPLAGSWTATAAERDGAAAPDLVGHRLTFDGQHFAIGRPDGTPVYGGTFTADAATDPPSVDFHNTSGEASGTTWLGIWRLAGDALTIADNAPDPTAPRPTALAAPKGYVLLTFARAAD